MAVAAGLTAAAALLAIGGLHLHWARGGTWPADDEQDLVELVAPPGGRTIPTGPTYAVAGLLVAAAALVVLAATTDAAVVGWAALAVASVLALRGGSGLVVSGVVSRSGRFARLDRRWYSPLCLVLAGLSALAAA